VRNRKNKQSKVTKRFIRNVIYNKNKAYIDKLTTMMAQFELNKIKEKAGIKDGDFYIN
jgi:hypothetical protein